LNKKVCMFVWNLFTNDARVIREASALSEAGYEVTIIALHDHSDGLAEMETMKGFTVIRVKKYWDIYFSIKKLMRNVAAKIKRLKHNKALLLVSIPLLIAALPLFIIYKAVGWLMKKGQILKITSILTVFIRMIRQGLKEDYVLYHSHDLNTLPQACICSLIKRGKLIYDSHEVQTSRTGYVGKRYYYLEKVFIRHIDKMIMTTNTRADYTRDLYRIEKPAVIHNYSVNIDLSHQSVDLHGILDIPREEPILLYQGGLQVGRGLDKILEAIPQIERGTVVFLGNGKLKDSLIEYCQKAGLQDRVRFHPAVPVDELLYYTTNATLGFQVLQNICFNHYSTLSNKLFEYMMAEVPVVASHFPEIKKIVEKEKIGIIIDPESSSSIAKAANAIVANAEKIDYRENCRRAKEMYNWDMEKRHLIQIYEDLLEPQ
jgi:glycosyltransferase involved in cell wall biosynthesis